MGLPGSGKTTLAQKLKTELETTYNKSVTWLNADIIRKEANDWDFSDEGRIRQANRITDLANAATTDYVIADFVAPFQESRSAFNADYTVWMDTIQTSRYEDTNAIFSRPNLTDTTFRVGEFNSDKVSSIVANKIVNDIKYPEFDYKKETVQMLGRYQPFHAGHRALFDRAIAKTGQVCIMIRDCQGWNDSNPFDTYTVTENINRALDLEYRGQYYIMNVPNIVNITYGRDVGYKLEQEVFDDATHAISATQIRRQMGLK